MENTVSMLTEKLPVNTKETKNVSDGVIGMIFLLATEVMFFAGIISAYIVNRAGAMEWPPIGQPRLPIEITAFNSLILISSALIIYLFKKHFVANAGKNISMKLLITTIFLGGIFLIIQGTEWIRLINYGLTTTSSLFGAFFYLIIGAHALHVMVGLIILCYLYFSIKNSNTYYNSKNKIAICSMYWYFVVGIWPAIYLLVYIM